MTPLQKAAQAVIRHWDKSIDPTDAMSELRKALEAEQAQGVEPFEIEFPDYHGQAMRYGLEDRNITDRYEAMRYGWDQALERVEDCLPEKLYTHPAPPPATGERAELIARLRSTAYQDDEIKAHAREAANMLEADAQAMSNLLARIHRDGGHYESEHGQIKAVDDADLIVAKLNALSDAQQVAVLTDIEQYRMQMAGISTAALGYWSEGDDIHSDYDTPALRDVARLYVKYAQLFKEKDALLAQQVAVPMTSQELEKCWTRVKGTSFGYAPFARAIEKHHGIGAKP